MPLKTKVTGTLKDVKYVTLELLQSGAFIKNVGYIVNLPVRISVQNEVLQPTEIYSNEHICAPSQPELPVTVEVIDGTVTYTPSQLTSTSYQVTAYYNDGTSMQTELAISGDSFDFTPLLNRAL